MSTPFLFVKTRKESILVSSMRSAAPASVLTCTVPVTSILGRRWCRPINQADHLGCIRAGGTICFQLRPISRQEARYRRAQGEYYVGSWFSWQAAFLTVHRRKMSDGMFLSACRQVSKEFPQISYDEDLLDRACLRVSIRNLYRNDRIQSFRTIVDHPKPRSLFGPGDGDAELVWRHLVRHVRWSHRWPGTDPIREHRTGERPFRLFSRIGTHPASRTLRSSRPSMAQHPILPGRVWLTPPPCSSPP